MLLNRTMQLNKILFDFLSVLFKKHISLNANSVFRLLSSFHERSVHTDHQKDYPNWKLMRKNDHIHLCSMLVTNSFEIRKGILARYFEHLYFVTSLKWVERLTASQHSKHGSVEARGNMKTNGVQIVCYMFIRSQIKLCLSIRSPPPTFLSCNMPLSLSKNPHAVLSLSCASAS